MPPQPPLLRPLEPLIPFPREFREHISAGAFRCSSRASSEYPRADAEYPWAGFEYPPGTRQTDSLGFPQREKMREMKVEGSIARKGNSMTRAEDLRMHMGVCIS